MLPGMGGNHAGVVGATSNTVEFVTSATSNLSTITIPATAAIGDFAYLVDYGIHGDVDPTSVTPTGWTNVADTDGASCRCMHSYKVLAAGEPGATITGINTTTDNKILLVFRPSFVIGTVTPSTYNGEGTTGNPAGQTVTAVGQTAPLIVFGSAGSDGAGWFSSTAPNFAGEVTNDELILGYTIYNTTPANHTVNMNDLGARNILQSGYVKLSA